MQIVYWYLFSPDRWCYSVYPQFVPGATEPIVIGDNNELCFPNESLWIVPGTWREE